MTEDLIEPLQPQVRSSIPEYLTKKEIKALMGAVDKETGMHYIRNKALVHLILYTGMRLKEIINLNWDDICFEKNIIWVISKKTGTKRAVPVNEDLKKVLLIHRADSLPGKNEAVFSGIHSQRLGAPSINRIIRDYAEKAGIKRSINFSVLRRTAIVLMVYSGMQFLNVCKVLGYRYNGPLKTF